MIKEKFSDFCPWDLGSNQKQSDEDEWILVNGDEFVVFSKNKSDSNWFNINKNNEVYEQFLSYQARLTYQKLLEKGFTLKLNETKAE